MKWEGLCEQSLDVEDGLEGLQSHTLRVVVAYERMGLLVQEGVECLVLYRWRGGRWHECHTSAYSTDSASTLNMYMIAMKIVKSAPRI